MRVLLASVALAAGVSPVEKVLQMLGDMVKRGQAELKQEADTYEKVEAIVHKRLIDTDIQIKREMSQIEKYDAAQQTATARAEELDEDVAELEGNNAENIGQYDARKATRAETKAEFQKTQKDLAESVDALTRAIQTLKSSQGSQKTIMAQLHNTLPQTQLEAFIQAQPASYSYESQSGGILGVLANLLDDFKGQLADAGKGEANRQHAWEMFSLDMTDEIKNVKAEIADKKEESASQKGKAGKAGADKEAAAFALGDAKKVKKDTQQYSSMNEAAFTANQQYRKDELKALNEAIEIISGEAVSGGQNKHFASFLQVNSQFLQSTKRQEVMKQAGEYLIRANAALPHKSEYLSLLSAQVMTGSPFDKVTGMIEQLISKLEEEAKAEGEHKAWCNKNLKETQTDRDSTQATVDKLNAAIEGFQSDRATKQDEKKQLESEVADHQKDMSETTQERNEERKENKQTIADAQAAQKALESAITVLQNFYEKSGEPALLQQDPQIQAYKGMGESNKGIVGLLETIESDFARLEADTTATEAQKQAEYDRMMEDTKKMVVDKKQAISDTKIAIINLNAEINKNNKQLGNRSKELKAILTYWQQLQPMCTVKQVSYEERVQQRNEEIAALKEAYTILSEEMSK